jgi:hypothetical protein
MLNHPAAIYIPLDVKEAFDLKSVWSCLHAMRIRTKQAV